MPSCAPVVAEVHCRQKLGFRAAFFAAGVGMALGTVIFSVFYRYLGRRGDRKKPIEPTPTADRAAPRTSARAGEDGRREGARNGSGSSPSLVIYAIVIVFWMVFHQNGSTMTYWADDNTDWNVSGVVSNAIILILDRHLSIP